MNKQVGVAVPGWAGATPLNASQSLLNCRRRPAGHRPRTDDYVTPHRKVNHAARRYLSNN